MYAWSNSATHHVVFPPRLQPVALRQNPDRLPAHLGRQLALDGLFGDQADRPTGPTFRRFTADHGNDALLLGAIENLLGSRSLFVVNGAIQAVPYDILEESSAGLWRCWERASMAWKRS